MSPTNQPYKKPIFVTSDWHIGHANSIEFDKRPFRDLDHMHSVLIRNHNKQVPKNGLCYFLGDMGVTGSGIIKSVIDQLNGTKVLVLGNHDSGSLAMYGCGFDVVVNGAVIYIKGQRITMSHCPLMGVFREDLKHIPAHKQKDPPENWHGETKPSARQFSFTDEGQFNLHGHLHSRNDTPHKTIISGRQMDVGCVGHGYRAYHFGEIESWMDKTIKAENEIKMR